MKQKHRRTETQKNRNKVFTLLLAVVLTIGCVIGGTMAWLIDVTDPVVNEFTCGDINIELTETEDTFKMVPGNDVAKDPKVIVESGSEACWLFVKVTKSENFDDFMTYSMEDGWTQLENVGTTLETVWYREVDVLNSKDDAEYTVLKDDKVTVLDTVSKDMFEAIKEGDATAPTLTFKAYAIQKSGFDTAATAWTEVSK